MRAPVWSSDKASKVVFCVCDGSVSRQINSLNPLTAAYLDSDSGTQTISNQVDAGSALKPPDLAQTIKAVVTFFVGKRASCSGTVKDPPFLPAHCPTFFIRPVLRDTEHFRHLEVAAAFVVPESSPAASKPSPPAQL